MDEKGNEPAKPIPSYLIECLVWNVPNQYFGQSDFSDDLRNSLIHIYDQSLEINKCKEWCEVNNIKYLFHTSQPWQYQQVNRFSLAAWNFVGFK